MNVLTIPRTAVVGSIKLARLPVDGALTLSRVGHGATSMKLALDRIEASVLGVAGAALRDDGVKQDARRKSEAADERASALRLRAEAAQRSERADQRVAERQHDADRRRADAAATAESKHAQAERRRESTKGQAAEAAQSRKQATEEAAARAQEAIDDRAKRERLETLDAKAEVLEEKERALAAADEAQQLSDAAAAAKANRKNGG